jgi:hypothetical protein
MTIEWSYTIEPPSSIADASGVADVDLLPIKDLALAPDGDLEVPPRIIGGVEAIAQRLRIRLSRWRGENFLDLDDGIPYAERIVGRRGSAAVARAILRRVILETPGVREILEFSAALVGRELRVTFRVSTRGGPDIVVRSGFNAEAVT